MSILDELCARLRSLHLFERADRMSGAGEYAVLPIGWKDEGGTVPPTTPGYPAYSADRRSVDASEVGTPVDPDEVGRQAAEAHRRVDDESPTDEPVSEEGEDDCLMGTPAEVDGCYRLLGSGELKTISDCPVHPNEPEGDGNDA